MKRQQRFVEIILLLLLALVVSFWGYRGYRFMQAHPLVNRVYRYQASSAAKAELTSDYQYVVFGAGRYRGKYIRVDNQKQLRRILNHRQAYQAAFDQNGTYYLVRHHQLQLDLGNVPAGESYVQTNKQAWVAQSDRHDLGQTVNDSLKLTSMHATKQAVSCLP